jgi:hypothetical protein
MASIENLMALQSQAMMRVAPLGLLPGLALPARPAAAERKRQDNYFHIEAYAYPPDAVPLFVGHYWLSQQDLESPNVACLDLSVAKSGGRLAEYCWDGETVLAKARFLTVERGPNASMLD